jgi:predicted RNA-binding Zn-ribbon protein involved in translation (DUF1610 family)
MTQVWREYMGKKLTTSGFVERAQKVHGDRYDYSVSVYIGAMNKVTIGCRVHGVFEQSAMDHMNGRGCSKCNERQPLTADIFIQRACEQHGHKYDYSLVQYKNVTTKVSIICPDHGVFDQTPKDHMHKYGCPSCGGTKPVSTYEFIRRAVEVHGHKYDYTLVGVTNMNSNVNITCSIHGIFSQRPADHLVGAGCPVCGTLKQGGYTDYYFHTRPGEKNKNGILYLIEVDNLYCKIGITEKRYVRDRFPSVRFRVISQNNMSLYEAFVKEQSILTKFASSRYKMRDLVNLRSGWTECFPLSMLEELKQEFISMEPY